MARGLFHRIGTLLAADAHGVVESLEERALLLKQYLREAERALDDERLRLESTRDDARRLATSIAEHERAAAALDEDVALALSGGKDDLARFAIRRLLPHRRALAAARAALAERTTEETEMAARVAEREAKLDALRARVRSELARERHETDAPCDLEPGIADEEVELELMRRRGAAAGGA
jgi:phage shock protein A